MGQKTFDVIIFICYCFSWGLWSCKSFL